jgi:hypothetical protein
VAVAMSRFRRRIDSNQNSIVKSLREIPGCSVALRHDDILVGYKGKNFWYEIKTEDCVSKKTGTVLESAKKDSQKPLEREWKGHYKIISNLDEILREIL